MRKKRVIICSAAAVLILIMVGAGIFITQNFADTPAHLLSLGEKYLTELNYEQALVQFLKVIEIDPMNPRGYTGAAEAYVGLGRTEDAIAVLQQGLGRTGDDGIRSMLSDLLDGDGTQPHNSGSGDSDATVANLTGKQPFSIEDLSAWGYPWGMSISALLESDLYNFRGDGLWVNIGANNKAERVLSHINITADSLVIGPRGIKVGMALEDAIDLFMCDNPDVLALVKEPHSSWVSTQETLYVVSGTGQGGVPDQGQLSIHNNGIASLWFTTSVDNQIGSCNLHISIQEGQVSEYYVDYQYDSYAEFNEMIHPNAVDLVDMESITILNRNVFEIFDLDMETVVNIASGQGYAITPFGDDGEMYRGTYGGSQYAPDMELTITQRKEDTSVVMFSFDTGWKERQQIGLIGIGNIDMSDDMATFDLVKKTAHPKRCQFVAGQ